jgi:hypothetical protein
MKVTPTTLRLAETLQIPKYLRKAGITALHSTNSMNSTMEFFGHTQELMMATLPPMQYQKYFLLMPR